MGRKAKEDLTEYMDWLMDVYFFEKESVKVYASSVRSVLRATDVSRPATVHHYFYKLQEEKSYKTGSHRAAWRRFCQWAREEKGIELPEVPGARRGRPPKEEEAEGCLPNDVLAVIAWFMKKSGEEDGGLAEKLENIYLFTWGMVGPCDRNPLYEELKHPTENGLYLVVPKAKMDVLRAYAKPEGRHTALIPVSPGSLNPVPVRQMRKDLRKYAKEQSN